MVEAEPCQHFLIQTLLSPSGLVGLECKPHELLSHLFKFQGLSIGSSLGNGWTEPKLIVLPIRPSYWGCVVGRA